MRRRMGSGRYAVGRVRSLERTLMDRAALERLLGVTTLHDLRQIMTEFDYPDGPVDDALDAKTAALYDLVYEMTADLPVLDVVRLDEDNHNVKVGLRKRLLAPNEPLARYQHLYRPYGLFEVSQLDEALRHDEYDRLPSWLTVAIAEAKARYAETRDPARIDLVIDQAFAAHQAATVATLGSAWLVRYMALRIDLKNAETISRALKRDWSDEQVAPFLLPGGFCAPSAWLAALSGGREGVVNWLNDEGQDVLATMVADDEADRETGAWSFAADALLMARLRETKTMLTGPEVPLAFLLAKRQEIRSIRLVLAAIRTRIPVAKRVHMVRSSFLERG